MTRPPRSFASRLGIAAGYDRPADVIPVRDADYTDAVRHLSVWGIAYRYPGLEDAPEPLPEIEELRRMIGMLTEFAATVGNLIDGE